MVLTVVAVAAALGASAAGQQCDFAPAAGAVIQNDGCDNASGSDANGGCNFASNPCQDLGLLTSGSSREISGTFGSFVPPDGIDYSRRDLDWFKLTTTEYGTITVALSAGDPVTGAELANPLVIVGNGHGVANLCDVPTYGEYGNGCPTTFSLFVGPGTHLVILTTDFEDDDLTTPQRYGCQHYLARISLEPLGYTVCDGSTGNCATAHESGGCDWPECCERVCAVNPDCCAASWDTGCAALSETECSMFVYSCSIGPGQPTNDCALNAQHLGAEQSIAFDTSTATTDGFNGVAAECAVDIGNDLWFVVEAPSAGQFDLTACDTTAATAIEVYSLGQESALSDPSMMRFSRIGCWSDNCGATGAQVTVIDLAPHDHLLIRIGGMINPATGLAAPVSGNLTVSFARVLFDTGAQKFILCNGRERNLGLSSGWLSALQPNRWLAQPFTLPPMSGGAGQWSLEAALVKGFQPSGCVNEMMGYVFWRRPAGNPPPNGGAALGPSNSYWLGSGSVPYPANFDDPDDSAVNASHLFALAAPLELNPGNYYFTVYAANSSGVPANFAWFTCCPGGVSLVDAGGAFAWRSASYPAPGFTRYALPTGYSVQQGDSPNAIYNCGFQLLGSSTVPEAVPCPGDFDKDGTRSANDLVILLAAWGTPDGDLDGDGTTSGRDITIMLALYDEPCQ